MATTRILVVDDEEDLCEILKFNLEIEGYEVDTAYSAEEALKKDLTIQLKELALDSAKFTKNYVGESNTRMDSNTQEYNYDTAKRNLKTAKTDKEMAIRNAYLQLQQMETQITSAQSSLTKAQADYRAAQINLRAGNVTKTAVEQAEMGVVSAQNSLNQLIYNYDMLVFTFENPSLLGNTAQAQ